jgi:hypothetical protein
VASSKSLYRLSYGRWSSAQVKKKSVYFYFLLNTPIGSARPRNGQDCPMRNRNHFSSRPTADRYSVHGTMHDGIGTVVYGTRTLLNAGGPSLKIAKRLSWWKLNLSTAHQPRRFDANVWGSLWLNFVEPLRSSGFKIQTSPWKSHNNILFFNQTR